MNCSLQPKIYLLYPYEMQHGETEQEKIDKFKNPGIEATNWF